MKTEHIIYFYMY